MPHTPHTTTIVAGVIPTKTLIVWREVHPKGATDIHTAVSRSPLIQRPPFSNAAHMKSWRIDHTMFSSMGGERPEVFYTPTPTDLHRKTWDPKHGQGSTRDGGQHLIPASGVGYHGMSSRKFYAQNVDMTRYISTKLWR